MHCIEQITNVSEFFLKVVDRLIYTQLRCHQDINKKKTPCTQNSLRLADLNDDGKVNQLNYNLLYRELLSKKQ